MGEALMPRRGGSSGNGYKIGYFQGNGGNEIYHADFINAKEVIIANESPSLSNYELLTGHFWTQEAINSSFSWPAVTYIEDGSLVYFDDPGHLVENGVIYSGMATFSGYYHYVVVY